MKPSERKEKDRKSDGAYIRYFQEVLDISQKVSLPSQKLIYLLKLQ